MKKNHYTAKWDYSHKLRCLAQIIVNGNKKYIKFKDDDLIEYRISPIYIKQEFNKLVEYIEHFYQGNTLIIFRKYYDNNSGKYMGNESNKII